MITVLYHRVIQQHPYTLFQLNTCPQPFLNNASLPQVTSVKYLGHRLDQKLAWRSLIWHKSKHINLKINELYWLIGGTNLIIISDKIFNLQNYF